MLPDVDATRVVLAGESRGGFLSVAYAAQGARRSRVVGVVKFVGGWVAQAEDRYPTDFNEVAFRRYGMPFTAPGSCRPDGGTPGGGTRGASQRGCR